MVIKSNRYILILTTVLLAAILFTGCSDEPESISSDLVEDTSTSEVSENLPDNDMSPDRDIVFNQNEVVEFNISISSENWELMQSDLKENIDDPMWVEAAITVNGITWNHVGIRYKGNSSLRSAVSSGNNKLSFKLDFDEFEDDYPETKNQRFYGFKQLNLNNNFSDPTGLGYIDSLHIKY